MFQLVDVQRLALVKWWKLCLVSQQ